MKFLLLLIFAELTNLLNRLEDGQTQMFGAGFGWRHSANHLGAVFERLLAVKCALFAGESLTDHSRCSVDHEVFARCIVWSRCLDVSNNVHKRLTVDFKNIYMLSISFS